MSLSEMLYIRITFLAVALVVSASAQRREDPWFIMPDDNGRLHKALLIDVPHFHPKDTAEDVKMLLYTRENQASEPYRLQVDENNIKESGFNPSHPTKILIHGFGSNGQSSTIIANKNAYLAKGEYNVIGVDWGVLCQSPYYVTACKNAEVVGEHLAKLIELLVSGGANLKNIHIIGHSLGAHVAGFAGRDTNSGKVGRITGLDTALPLFGNVNASQRLDPSDAVLVDGIHTCGGSLGFSDPYADVDFYPNGGLNPQPGCESDLTGACSHGKSVEYFTRSIVTEDAFPAIECQNVEEAESGTCSGNLSGIMGDSIKFSANPGIYYTSTTSTFEKIWWK